MRSCGTGCVEQSLSLQLKAGGMRARRLLGVWNWPPLSEKHAFLLFDFFENHAEPSGDDAIEALAGRYHESDNSSVQSGTLKIEALRA